MQPTAPSLFPFTDAAPTITILVEHPPPPSPTRSDAEDKPRKGSSPGSSPRRSRSPGRGSSKLSLEAQLSIQRHKEARLPRPAQRRAWLAEGHGAVGCQKG